MSIKALSILALILTAAAPAPAAPVTVKVTGIESNGGRVIVSLCTKTQWMVSPCSYSTSTPARTGGVTVVFNTVAPGRYMAAAFQDLDGDGDLKLIAMVPGEPAGVSGPPGLIPNFERAAFDVAGEPKAVNVILK